MNIKILHDLTIESCHLIMHCGKPWPKQGLMRIKTPEELSRIIAQAVKTSPSEFLFKPLTIGKAWYVALRGIKVGTRLDHGNGGKKGLSFPLSATQYSVDEAGAIKAKEELVAYFVDLAANSFYSDKTKQAGHIKANHFLFV